jgi:hypothetical protein
MDQPQLPKTRPTRFTRMFGATRYVTTVASLFVLPKRQSRGDYIEPDYPFRQVPAKY